MPHRAGFFFRQHFQIGDRRVQLRIPVHQTLAAIDQAILVQTHEGLLHGLGQTRVHGEALTRPVHR